MKSEREAYMKKMDEYEMPRSEAIAEHKRLVRVLRSGTRAEQLKEADIQERELRKILSFSDDDED